MDKPSLEASLRGMSRDELFAELGKLPYDAFQLAEFKKQARALALQFELQRRCDQAKTKAPLTAAELARFSRAGCS